MKSSAAIDPVDWIKVTLFGLLLAGIYYTTFQWLIIKDWTREDYTYGWLIPLIALYLVWEKRSDFLNALPRASWTGLLLFIPGLLLFWLGELAGEYFAMYFSFWLILIGLLWLNLGWEKIRTIGFALLISLGMFPPPHFIHNKITLQLKLISSQIGVAFMQLYGMSVYREGNVIDLGFTQLQVVDACSGLRYLFPLFIMSLLLAYFFKAKLWKKVILVLSSIPLTIFTNSFRIAMTGILSEIWGPKVAEGFFHGFSGWFIFMFGLAMLLLEMWVLSGFGSLRSLGLLGSSKDEKESKVPSEPNAQKSLNDNNIPNDLNAQNDPSSHPQPLNSIIRNIGKSWWQSLLSPPQFVVAVLLLGATLVLAQGVEFREKIPPAKAFSKFPMQVGQWNGKRDIIEQAIVDTLDLSQYIIADYKNQSNKVVNFYTAYYETQRKGESIHSPATCLPGGGWEFREAGTTVIPVANGDKASMPVNRAFMLKNAYRQVSYYWFPMRGRILTNAYQMKLYNFWDALTRQRTDGALVRLITPVYPGEEVGDADKRLVAFTREIVPVLNEFLPD